MALQTFNRKTVPEPILRQMSAASLQEAERLGRLIDNLLLSTKMEEGYQPYNEDICVVELVKRCIQSLESRYPNRRIDFHTSHNSLLKHTDSMGMESVVYNLIENALKYSPQNEPVEVDLKTYADQLVIEVRDRGIGIAPEQRSTIFQKFYRVKDEQTRQTKGTGLGLYIVGELTRALGGQIRVSANTPQGSVFTLSIPTRNVA
jgi:signal transduction histidine kinase